MKVFSHNESDISKILFRKHALPFSRYHTYCQYAFSTLGVRCVYMHFVILLVHSDTAVVVFFSTPQFALSVDCCQRLMESLAQHMQRKRAFIFSQNGQLCTGYIISCISRINNKLVVDCFI